MAVNYIGVGRFAVALENKTVPAQNCQLEVNQLLSLKSVCKNGKHIWVMVMTVFSRAKTQY